MKIYIKTGKEEITFDLCECSQRAIHPNNLVPLPEVSTNPMIEVGDYHNHVVTELSRKGIQLDGDRTVDELIKIGESYSFSPAIQKTVGKFDPEEFIKLFRTNIIDGCFPEFPPMRYPDFYDDFMKNMYLNTMYEARNFDSATSDVHKIHRRLLGAERTIKENDMSKADKKKAYAVIAVAQRSLEYWHNEALVSYKRAMEGPKVEEVQMYDPFRVIRQFGADVEAYSDYSDFGKTLAGLYAGWVSYNTD